MAEWDTRADIYPNSDSVTDYINEFILSANPELGGVADGETGEWDKITHNYLTCWRAGVLAFWGKVKDPV